MLSYAASSGPSLSRPWAARTSAPAGTSVIIDIIMIINISISSSSRSSSRSSSSSSRRSGSSSSSSSSRSSSSSNITKARTSVPAGGRVASEAPKGWLPTPGLHNKISA